MMNMQSGRFLAAAIVAVMAALPHMSLMAAPAAALAGRVSPWAAAGAPAAYVDDTLKLRFDTAPVLGTAGAVRIYSRRDDALVDTILAARDIEQLGYAGMDQLRVLHNTPFVIEGNTVTIKPHSDKLAAGTEYYVVIDDGVLTGATLGGAPFHSVGKGAWQFATRAAMPRGSTVTVDDDGPADFRSIQGALNYVMKNVARDSAATINVKNGRYHEMLFLRGKNKVTIQGESRDGVVIEFNNSDGLNPGTGASTPVANVAEAVAGSAPIKGGRSLLLVEGADLLTLSTLTLRSSHLKTGKGDQAESIYFNSPERLIAKNVSFIGRQDTLLINGYSWFYDCLVAGDVDFIWGYANAALFENSEIRSVVDNTDADKGGYVLQARSRLPADRGYIFLNSRLTSEAGVPAGKTYLARSSGRNTSYDHIAFINTEIGAHIAPEGWHIKPPPTPAIATAAGGWREYNSKTPSGAPLDVGARVAGYSTQLTADDYRAGYASRARIFAAYNNNAGWNPQP